jgi:hypothetical protein
VRNQLVFFKFSSVDKISKRRIVAQDATVAYVSQ